LPWRCKVARLFVCTVSYCPREAQVVGSIILPVDSSSITSIPPGSGTYVLVLVLDQPKDIQPGHKRITYNLQPGYYLYVGSAFGPGGLRARLGRHIRGSGKVHHWHIDALREVAVPVAFACYRHPTRYPDIPLECRWAQALSGLPDAAIPILGFGASDCRSGCAAHLVHFPDTPLKDTEEQHLFLNEIILRTLAFQANALISEVKLGKINPQWEL